MGSILSLENLALFSPTPSRTGLGLHLNLRCLKLDNCIRVNDACFEYIANTCCALEDLVVKWGNFGNLGLEHLGRLARLREVEFVECDMFDTVESLAHLKSLESLTLSSCYRVDHGFDSLAHAGSLRDLNVNLCTSFGNASFKAVCAISQLESLSCGMCPKVGGTDVFERMVQLLHLQWLYLELSSLRDIDVLAVLENNRALSTLDLSNCCLVTDSVLDARYLTSPRLRTLDLSGTKCTPRAVAALQKTLPPY